MTQNEFFDILMDGLKDFSEIKLQDIISYYEHYFTIGLTAGKAEEDIINELGNPNLIVNKLRNENLDITINSQNVINHIDNEASNIDATAFTKNENINVDNKSNDINNDFKTNSNLHNNSIEKEDNFKIHNNFNNFKSNNSYASNDDFYDLYNENISPDNQESNYKSITSDKSYYNFHSKNSFNCVLFSLGSISLSILLIILFYYLCKFFILILAKIYISLKSKGGALCSSGNINFNNITASTETKLDSSSGDIIGSGNLGTINGNTSSVDMNLRFINSLNNICLSTHSGSITLSISKDLGYKVN